MSNHIELRGVITHIALRPSSLFMTVREEIRGNTQHGAQHTVKAYAPRESQEPPEMWAQRLQHLEKGMTVIVEGKQSFERETRRDDASGEYIPVRHPHQDRDLFTPYIWAFQIDAIFDPSIHMKRSQQQSGQQRSEAPQSPAPRQAPRQAGNLPPPQPEDDLPPMPSSDVAWN